MLYIRTGYVVKDTATEIVINDNFCLAETTGLSVHCLTFEVEEHFQVLRFDSPMRRRHWHSYESRVAANVARLLELLENHRTKATFFVLGWVAERHPALIKTIAGSGHEIASHGYNHEVITAQTPDLFREDVKRAKELLEELTGRPVRGYRAPGFTITSETTWALPILVEEGYTYDSSIIPARHDVSSMPGTRLGCHMRETPAGYLWEVQPTTARLAGMRWPLVGSGFRLVPFSLIETLLQEMDRSGQGLVMCFHAWEFDQQQPRMDGPFFSQLLHYLNLHQMEPRLVSLLRQFTFGPIEDYIGMLRTAPADHSLHFSPSSAPAIVTDPV